MTARGILALVVALMLGATGCVSQPEDMASKAEQNKLKRTIAAQADELALLDGRLQATATLLEELHWQVEDLSRRTDAPPPAEPILPPRLHLPVEPAPAPPPDWNEGERKLAGIIEERMLASTDEPTESNSEGELGRRLPLNRFLASDGSVLDLTTYRDDKRVVLVLLRGFAGQICLNCSVQTRALSKSVAEFASRDAQVLLVYPGEARSVPQFLEAVTDLGADFQLPFPVLLDVDLTFVRAMRLEGELAKPSSFILDKDGVVRYAYVGENLADRPSVQDLLSALDGLED